MREPETMSHEQGLHLIEQMIATAKNEHRERGDGWLLWGWLLFGASIASVVLMRLALARYIGNVWTGMLALGLLVGLFTFLLRRRRREPVRTYAGELLSRISTGFFASLLSMVAAAYLSGQGTAFGYYYILYAFWMFIYGSVLRFRPLLVGAVVNWAAALLIFWVNDFYYTMIISAVAVLIGYLIPGYLLRRQYHQSVNRS